MQRRAIFERTIGSIIESVIITLDVVTTIVAATIIIVLKTEGSGIIVILIDISSNSVVFMSVTIRSVEKIAVEVFIAGCYCRFQYYLYYEHSHSSTLPFF